MKKKLFISVPTKGRTEENIKHDMDKMHKIAEAMFGESLEVIDSYVEEEPPADTNTPVWYLGKSIQKLSEADYFVGVGYLQAFKGCEIEMQIARQYNIPVAAIDIAYLLPDVAEIENRLWESNKAAPLC